MLKTNAMKIFLDSADTKVLHDGYLTGLIDGITTNPTLIRKSGRDPEAVYQELKDIGYSDISMEVVGDGDDMYEEGTRLYSKFGDCATIKVPCTPDGLYACRKLARKLIRVNVTLIFSPSQAILAAKAGAKYVSPFVGRVDDNSFGGLCLVKDISNVYMKQGWYDTEILAASIRNVRDVSRAFEYGANICTIPPTVFHKMYNHVLTDQGLALFDEDFKITQKMIGG
jgi:transaldolase|tara:strand:+ start:323 stop:1000 length:678 start_codon:yes stop_codon:yes gene_type:complete